MRLWTTGWMMGTLVLLAAGGQLLLNGQSRGSYDGFKLVDKSGNISKPPNYRDTFRVMGTYAVIDVKGNELHYSYARRAQSSPIVATKNSRMAAFW